MFSQLIAKIQEIFNIDKSSSTNDQTNLKTTKLDRASILRETSIYLRQHHDRKIYFFFILFLLYVIAKVQFPMENKKRQQKISFLKKQNNIKTAYLEHD